MGWVKAGAAAAVGLAGGVWLAGQWLGGASALGVAMPERGAPGPAIVGAARVVDGDTVRIGSVRIRIQGIDAPEMDDSCRRADGSHWDCGAWATEVARERFGGRRLVCHDLGERSYDRVVARCMDGEEDFAAVMLDKGAARACERFALRHPHSQEYMSLEDRAAAAGRGIFDGTPPPRAGFCETRRAEERTEERAEVQLAAGDCVIKGNINTAGERIYHLPGQAHYDRVVIRPELGQRWFCSEEEAEAAGWRRSLR